MGARGLGSRTGSRSRSREVSVRKGPWIKNAPERQVEGTKALTGVEGVSGERLEARYSFSGLTLAARLTEASTKGRSMRPRRGKVNSPHTRSPLQAQWVSGGPVIITSSTYFTPFRPVCENRFLPQYTDVYRFKSCSHSKVESRISRECFGRIPQPFSVNLIDPTRSQRTEPY